MSFFEFSQKLHLEIPRMDDQHKELIRRMNVLHDYNEAKAGRAKILKAFEDLNDYTVQHFAEEEKYMATFKYAKIEAHKNIHKNLLATLGEHLGKFRNGSSETVSYEVFGFLSFWLKAHIMGIDTQYAADAKKAKAA